MHVVESNVFEQLFVRVEQLVVLVVEFNVLFVVLLTTHEARHYTDVLLTSYVVFVTVLLT